MVAIGGEAKNPRYVGPKRKARQNELTSLFGLEPGCETGVSGGGGDRTRVPRHFHACFYVCIRLFEFN